MSKFFHSVKPPLLTHFLVFIVNRVKKSRFLRRAENQPKRSERPFCDLGGDNLWGGGCVSEHLFFGARVFGANINPEPTTLEDWILNFIADGFLLFQICSEISRKYQLGHKICARMENQNTSLTPACNNENHSNFNLERFQFPLGKQASEKVWLPTCLESKVGWWLETFLVKEHSCLASTRAWLEGTLG